MDVVSVSPQFQIVIPRAITEALGLQPGQRMQAFRYGHRVELIPMLPLAQARGFLAGIQTDVVRDGDRT